MIDYSIALSKVPNQSFQTTLNGNAFEFAFRTFRGLIYASAYANGDLVQAGARCVPDTPIFNADVDRLAGGVMLFKCADGAYPEYTDFDGSTCRLLYVPFGEELP